MINRKDFIRTCEYLKELESQGRTIKDAEDFTVSMYGAPMDVTAEEGYHKAILFKKEKTFRTAAVYIAPLDNQPGKSLVLVFDPSENDWRNFRYFLEDHEEISDYSIMEEIGKEITVRQPPPPGIYWACFFGTGRIEPPLWACIKVSADGVEMVRTNGLTWKPIETIFRKGYTAYILQDKIA
jgi:hypothetical protein